MSIPRAPLIVAAALLLAGCNAARLHEYEYAQLHMGVQVRLTVYAPDERTARTACAAAYARVAALEDISSDYRPSSELMRLCGAPPNQPVVVSRELFFVLRCAQMLSEQSGGAFDVTVGPYVALWRQARRDGKLPPNAELKRARESVGWQFVRLDTDNQTVTLLRPNMRLDFGGIAKGYAGDEAIATLRRFGISRALFEAGGDIVAGDPPPDRAGWTIRVPDSGMRFTVARAGISTSGDAAQFVIIDGVRYSHVVDPRTGIGLTDRYAATVIAPDGITADGLSTAACVLGPIRIGELMRSYRAAEVYIRKAH